jgi:hypothetical protein
VEPTPIPANATTPAAARPSACAPRISVTIVEVLLVLMAVLLV